MIDSTRHRLLRISAALVAALLGCRTRPYDDVVIGDLGALALDGGAAHEGGIAHDGGTATDAGTDGGGGPRVCLSDRAGRPLQLHAGGAAYTLAAPVRLDLYPMTPWRIAVGDVTGDARADLVGGDPDHVVILAQRDDGSLESPQTLAHSFSNPTSVALLDATGDGVFDVIATSGVTGTSSNGFDVFDALGGGSFGSARHVTAPIGWDLQVGDIDGDGRADLVSPSDRGPVVLANDGAGGLGAPQLIANVGTQLGYRLALGDVTGDGALDLVALSTQATSLVVVPNVGGAFAADGWTTVAVSGATLRDVAVGDVSGDGRPDLVTQEDSTGVSSARTWLLAGVPGGGFAAPVQIAEASYGGGLAIADVNGDGRNDVVLMHEGGYNIGVLIGSGGGVGAEHVYKMPTGASLESLAVADIDCDGCPDVLVADTGGVVIFAGEGCGR